MPQTTREYIVPENIIFKVVNAIFAGIKNDLATKSVESETILAFMFENETFNTTFDYFTQAKDLLNRVDPDPRKIHTRLFYDMDGVRYPSVSITLPSVSPSQQFLGSGLDGRYYFDNPGDSATRHVHVEEVQATSHLIIASDNHGEVAIIDHILRAGFLSLRQNIALMGLKNLKTGANDLIHEDFGNEIFKRTISLNYEYEISVPEYLTTSIVDTLNLTINIC